MEMLQQQRRRQCDTDGNNRKSVALEMHQSPRPTIVSSSCDRKPGKGGYT